jgi:hypothetical protein
MAVYRLRPEDDMTADQVDPDHPQSPRVAEILVRKSVIESGDWDLLAEAVLEFKNDLHEYGGYDPSELPAELNQSYWVDVYDAQVKNGGHWQFVLNSEWANPVVDDIWNGLSAIGARGYLGIFTKVRELVESGTELSHDGIPDARLQACDREFFAIAKVEDLRELTAAWIATLPNLRVVDDDAWVTAFSPFARANPIWEERVRNIDSPEGDRAQVARLETSEETRAQREGALLCEKAGIVFARVASAGWANRDGLWRLEQEIAASDTELFSSAGPVLMGVLDTDHDLAVLYSSDKGAVLLDPLRGVVLARHRKS